jgi:hypothetical protein
MIRLRHALVVIALVAGGAAAMAACNSTGDCPVKGSIVPGASCSDDQLQCAYDLATPSLVCDGTNTVIPSSCTCMGGAWACPSPATCEAGTGDDGAASDDGASEASGDDAAAEAATDTGGDAPGYADGGDF